MPEIKTFIDFIQAGGFVGLLIILAFPPLRKKFGFTNGNGVVPQWAEELQEHFNHTTTGLLQEIRDNTRDSLKSLERIERDGVNVKK